MPDREKLLKDWLEREVALKGMHVEQASDDASFRSYFRVTADQHEPYIAMDAPPDKEDVRPFIRVAEMIEPLGLHVPHIFSRQIEQGFLLLEDLGSEHYLDVLDDGNVERLYGDAAAALLKLHAHAECFDLPAYDEAMLRREMELFPEWLCGRYLGIQFSATETEYLERVFQALVGNALDQPVVTVLRDYHSRNLLVVENNNPGVIDFQDAVNGPITYDLVSLYKDCYIQWPREKVKKWVSDYYQRLLAQQLIEPVGDDRFLRWFDLMGVQRHLKASGIFARLNLRDGKIGYMKNIPRTLQYITALGPDYPELAFLVDLIDSKVLPSL